MIKIRNSLKCDICGYEWVSKDYIILNKLPKVCPKCKRYDWNENNNNQNKDNKENNNG